MKVLHTDIIIEYFNDKEVELQGEYTDLPVPTVRINTAYSLESQTSTKIHEYFHGLYRLVHDPDEDSLTEEQAARLFELGVVDLAKQNPELLLDLMD